MNVMKAGGGGGGGGPVHLKDLWEGKGWGGETGGRQGDGCRAAPSVMLSTGMAAQYLQDLHNLHV